MKQSYYAAVNQVRCSTPSRNPLLQDESYETKSRLSKAQVPSYLAESRWLDERPKGIAKGAYSYQSQGSFKIGTDNNLPFKPTKKVFSCRNTLSRPEVPVAIKARPQTPSRNPLFLGDEEAPPQSSRKKLINPDPPCLYDDVANNSENSQRTRRTSYDRRNSSSVFEQNNKYDPFGSHKKHNPKPRESLKKVLAYDYALPYREDKITTKPWNEVAY
ncbi:unnamed protein product [Blepharisma stoltei]|uniref:Uncharacterized protein n=1 Tax=Blepharisma stoltei TaxID=1481888 RepID=A0AAU9JP29_9CILI|nr:unnamed protein product [Blepharisma stoltei]